VMCKAESCLVQWKKRIQGLNMKGEISKNLRKGLLGRRRGEKLTQRGKIVS